MAFDSLKFSALALELVEPKRQPQEEHIRTACGRAYYAAFLLARDRLSKIGKVWGGKASGKSEHAFVRSTLSGSLDPTVSALGQNLSDLFDKRRHADYELASKKYSFVQSLGALMALAASTWIQDFQKIPESQLRAACP